MTEIKQTFFDNERNKQLKTFWEIKKDLKGLLKDVKQKSIIEKNKQKIEDNIIKNLKEWLKIISWDYLYPLKYLTSYNTIFTFEKNIDNIFPWDILKLEWENLIIIRKNKKIHIWKIVKKEKKNIILTIQNKNLETKTTKKVIKKEDNIKNNNINWEKEANKYLKEWEDPNYNFEKLDKNLNLKEIFNNFYEKQKINIWNEENPKFLTKEEILKLVENNYLKAITLILIYKNEQWLKEWLISRQTIKNIIKSINKDWIKSRWLWQIRTNSFNKIELKKFFNNKNLNLLNDEYKKLFNKLKIKFEKNQKLEKQEKIELLENNNLETLFLNSILDIRKQRSNKELKKDLNIDWKENNLSKQEIFFYSTLLANAYHMWWIWAVRKELFTNNLLKIAENFNLLKTKTIYDEYFIKHINNYQTKLREEYKWWWFHSWKLYKRNNEIQKQTINLIINYLEKNNITKYWNIEEIKSEIKNLTKWPIPEKIKNLVLQINKDKNINPINFNPSDYNNIDPKKAIFIWNYWPRAWNLLTKK